MGKNTQPSGSHECHDWLSKQPIGHEFTFIELFHDINRGRGKNNFLAGPELSMGVVTGFITRAKRMGMIEVIGSVKVLAKRKPIFKYRYVKKVDWKFKPPGIGSHPGREIMGRKHDTAEGIGNLIQQVDASIAATGETKDRLLDALDTSEAPVLEREFEYDQGSLSDQLINLAIKVNDLENRPVKTLSDYSTNDLIEELKKRVK